MLDWTYPTQSVLNAMNLDVAPGRQMRQRRLLSVCLVWVGEVKGFVEAAGRLPGVDDVSSFGGEVITFVSFWSAAPFSERHFVSS